MSDRPDIDEFARIVQEGGFKITGGKYAPKQALTAKDTLGKLRLHVSTPITTDEAAQALYEHIMELIGEDEPDESKDAYSQTAIYKDYRNNLRQELRQKLATYFGVEL